VLAFGAHAFPRGPISTRARQADHARWSGAGSQEPAPARSSRGPHAGEVEALSPRRSRSSSSPSRTEFDSAKTYPPLLRREVLLGVDHRRRPFEKCLKWYERPARKKKLSKLQVDNTSGAKMPRVPRLRGGARQGSRFPRWRTKLLNDLDAAMRGGGAPLPRPRRQRGAGASWSG